MALRARRVCRLRCHFNYCIYTIDADCLSQLDPSNNQKGPLDPASRRKIMSGLIENIHRKSTSSQQPRLFQGVRRFPVGNKGASDNSSATRPPGRPLDARAFAATNGAEGGAPRLRTAQMLKNLKKRSLRPNRASLGKNLALAAAAVSRGRHDPRFAKAAKPKRRRRNDREEDLDSEETHPNVQRYFAEKAEAERPKAMRHKPVVYTAEGLKETWPSLPIESEVASSSILDKLNWMGERYLGSFESPQELAERVLDGKRVMFRSDEERDEVMEMVKMRAAERAEKLTERKGSVVEAEDVSFQTLTEKERMELVGSVIAGQYEAMDQTKPGVLAQVNKNLYNNETYNQAQSAQFMDALTRFLPKAKPAARAK